MPRKSKALHARSGAPSVPVNPTPLIEVRFCGSKALTTGRVNLSKVMPGYYLLERLSRSAYRACPTVPFAPAAAAWGDTDATSHPRQGSGKRVKREKLLVKLEADGPLALSDDDQEQHQAAPSAAPLPAGGGGIVYILKANRSYELISEVDLQRHFPKDHKQLIARQKQEQRMLKVASKQLKLKVELQADEAQEPVAVKKEPGQPAASSEPQMRHAAYSRIAVKQEPNGDGGDGDAGGGPGSAERRTMLEAFYREHAPQKMNKVETALTADCSDQFLLAELRKKYIKSAITPATETDAPAVPTDTAVGGVAVLGGDDDREGVKPHVEAASTAVVDAGVDAAQAAEAITEHRERRKEKKGKKRARMDVDELLDAATAEDESRRMLPPPPPPAVAATVLVSDDQSRKKKKRRKENDEPPVPAAVEGRIGGGERQPQEQQPNDVAAVSSAPIAPPNGAEHGSSTPKEEGKNKQKKRKEREAGAAPKDDAAVPAEDQLPALRHTPYLQSSLTQRDGNSSGAGAPRENLPTENDLSKKENKKKKRARDNDAADDNAMSSSDVERRERRRRRKKEEQKAAKKQQEKEEREKKQRKDKKERRRARSTVSSVSSSDHHTRDNNHTVDGLVAPPRDRADVERSAAVSAGVDEMYEDDMLPPMVELPPPVVVAIPTPAAPHRGASSSVGSIVSISADDAEVQAALQGTTKLQQSDGGGFLAAPAANPAPRVIPPESPNLTYAAVPSTLSQKHTRRTVAADSDDDDSDDY